MKKFIYTLVLVLILNSAFLIQNSFAQWEPDVRLTNSSGDSYTAINNAWSIAANGNVVHVVWYDFRHGVYGEIYYKRSTDGGTTWGADTRLTNNTAESYYPCIAVSGSQVNVVWSDKRDGNVEIYYKRSTDGGTTWGADARLTNNTDGSWSPSLAVSGSQVHVVWCDERDGTAEIYYKRSTDGGTTWGADTRLTNNTAYSQYPSIAVSGSQVNLVWDDDRDGNNEIYFKRSTDGGTSWGADTRLTNNTAYSQYPSIAVSGSQIHVVWHDGRDGNPEIYYKRSTDGGTNWGADTRLTNNSADGIWTNIAVTGEQVHVVWQDNRDGDYEIYYKRSTDGGTIWGADTRLTNNTALSYNPSVAVSGSQVHIVWNDNRDGNWEIYYKRTLPPVPSVPTLVSPVNNSIGQPLSLNLIWNKTQYSIKYKVLLATDSLFTNVILNDSLLTDSVKSLTNLNTLTNYYWKVSAGNTTGWSSYSSIYKFKTIGSPTQVNLFSPANNAINQPVNITFKWYKAIDQTVKTIRTVSNYWLEYSTDSSFLSGVVKDSILTDTLKTVSAINTATKYYWRVRAKNIAGWGNFSSVWNFTTVPPIPVAPVLVSPANNATNLQPNVLLDWNSVQYAANYSVQIASDSLFTSMVFDTSNVNRDSLRVRPGLLIANTKYYWRVNAVNISGTGPWSTVWNFRINPTGTIYSGNEIPTEFRLYNNFPNPFNPTTTIRFSIVSSPRVLGGDLVQLKVYDVMGREVQTLVNERLQPGTYETSFDGTNFPSGIYFYRMITDGFIETKRMTLIK